MFLTNHIDQISLDLNVFQNSSAGLGCPGIYTHFKILKLEFNFDFRPILSKAHC